MIKLMRTGKAGGFIFLAVFWLIIGLHPMLATETCLVDNTTKIDLENCLYIYEDETRKLSIHDVFEVMDQFVRKQDGNLNFGFSNSAYWIMFKIKNEGDEPGDFHVQVRNPDINYISFYDFANGKLIQKTITGESYLFKSRDNNNRNFVFKLNLDPGVVHTIFIRCYNDGDALFVPINVQPDSMFLKGEYRDMLIHGSFYGIILLILLLNVYLFRSLRDKIYLYYVFYAFFVFLFIFNVDGLFFKYMVPGTPWLANHLKPVFPTVSIVFLLRISNLFLQADKHPVAKRWITGLEIFAHLVIVFSLFNGKLFLAGIIGALAVYSLAFLMVFIFSITLFSCWTRPSRFFTSSFLFMLLATLIYVLRDMGVVPNSVVTENIGRVSLFGQSTLLLLAVIERFKLQQEESRKIIQERSEEIETQKERLIQVNTELEKLSIVASEVDNGVAIYNIDGSMEWCNSGFEKLHGMTLSAIQGSRENNILKLISHPGINDIVHNALETKEPEIFESEMVNKQGKKIWLQTTLTPFVDEKNEILKLITLDSDITPLKNYEFKLIEAKNKAEEGDRLKTAFLSNISHEIRTPLNAILGFSELLKDSEDFPVEKQKNYIKIIQNNGRHLLQLITAIIDISRLETEEVKLDYSKGNLNKMVDEQYLYFKTELKDNLKKPIELNFYKGENDDRAEIITDHYKLQQVLSNLISNAIKFTKKGFVEYGYHLKKDQLEFYVKDTGIGIPMEKKEVIFQRFMQIEIGLSRQYEGAGLGLYLARGLVHKMGGKIWLDSTEGVGTTFYFRVPVELDLPKGHLTGNDEFRVFNWEDKKFLLVEDTPEISLFMAEVLRPTGVVLEKASNGAEALDKVKTTNYDLILMDIRLPDINGFEVTKRIRSFNKIVPIIAQTAIAIDSEKNRCFEAGCNDYISKPINTKKLLHKIDDNLRE